MSIEFQDDNLVSASAYQGSSVSGSGSAMVDFLINHGVVKDEKTANTVLVVGSLIFIAISIYIFIFGF